MVLKQIIGVLLHGQWPETVFFTLKCRSSCSCRDVNIARIDAFKEMTMFTVMIVIYDYNVMIKMLLIKQKLFDLSHKKKFGWKIYFSCKSFDLFNDVYVRKMNVSEFLFVFLQLQDCNV